ncbi:MAG TPA: glycosyltransferase family 2 protein [Caulobacteraceae bacterium]|nr:glycosyltransferase family 2 protein [Caulobacteraceae bacterium]
MLDDITPVILTFDEAPNIGRCLERLSWAKDIVVVDSGSGDGTQEICRRFSQVRLFTRAFDTHAQQWNFAIAETGIASGWMLCLDADYMLTAALIEDLRALRPSNGVDGYWMSFRYAVMGKVLRSGIYPPVLSLIRRGASQYVQDGHTQRARVDGQTAALRAHAIHDDQKPFDRWLRSQAAYARLEADKLVNGRAGGSKGWLRTRTPFSIFAVGFYCLIWRGGLLEGPAGWFYVLQRMIAEGMIAAAIVDRRLRKPP